MLRRLDYLIGVPMVCLFSIGFKPRKFPTRVNVIGLIQPTAIGDIVLASNLITGLHHKYPEAKIILFCGKSNYEVASLICAPVQAVLCNFKNPFKAVRVINSFNTDLLIDLVSWSRTTALVACLSNSKYSIGFNGYKQHRSSLFDKQVKHLLNRHERDNFYEIAKTLNVSLDFQPGINLVDAHDIFSEFPLSRCIVFHLAAGGSMAKFKCWPNERWAELGRVLCSRGYSILLTGVNGDRSKLNEVIATIGYPAQCVNMAGKLSIKELALLLSKVKLVISIDTGILHLASWVNAPVLGLHGPTSSLRWGVLNPNGRSINSPHFASGYINFGFERSGAENLIMESISVEMVLNQAEVMLEK